MKVNASRLRVIGGGIADTATAFTAIHTKRGPDLAPAGGGSPGWQTTTVLRAAATAWDGYLTQAGGAMAALAAALVTAADNYRAADVAAAHDQSQLRGRFR